MNKTKIEWTDYTWNPILGICPVGCKLPDGRSYCYARKIYKRFKLDPTPCVPWRDWFRGVTKIQSLRKPSKIFVCSTFELFHPSVKRDDRNSIFNVIKDNPKHTFQILTKLPQNIDRPMPDNVWLGVSITEPIEMYPRIKNLYEARAKLKFISFEPLLGDVGQFHFQGWLGKAVSWIIMGRLTQYGHKYDPKKFWIESILNHAKKYSTPVFLKDNLKDIWGGPLIQEMPKETS